MRGRHGGRVVKHVSKKMCKMMSCEGMFKGLLIDCIDMAVDLMC